MPLLLECSEISFWYSSERFWFWYFMRWVRNERDSGYARESPPRGSAQ